MLSKIIFCYKFFFKLLPFSYSIYRRGEFLEIGKDVYMTNWVKNFDKCRLIELVLVSVDTTPTIFYFCAYDLKPKYLYFDSTFL